MKRLRLFTLYIALLLIASCAKGSVEESTTATLKDGKMTIMTAADFMAFVEYVNQGEREIEATQIGNIDLSGKSISPIGTDVSSSFNGVYNGNGRYIKNLTIKSSSSDNVALFGCLGKGAIVKGMTLQGVTIDGGDCVGGIAGYIDGAIIENSTIISGSISGENCVGGIVGYSNGGRVIACANNASITGVDCIGGVVGSNIAVEAGERAVVSTSVNKGVVAGSNQVGGVVGVNSSQTKGEVLIAGSFNTANVSGTGKDIDGAVGKSDEGATLGCYYISENEIGDSAIRVASIETLNAEVNNMNLAIPIDVEYLFEMGSDVTKDLPKAVKATTGNRNYGFITVNIDDKKQIFTGGGGACGFYAAHWLSMTDDARNKAGKLIADCNVDFVKVYVNYRPSEDSREFDRAIQIYNDIKKYKSDLGFQLNVNDLPDDLEQKDQNGESIKTFQDETIPDVYEKIAEYYFECIEYMHKNGVPVDELDLLNEPGSRDLAVFHGKKYAYSVDHLREIINDPIRNTLGIKMPKIVGVSLWGVSGTVAWFEKWEESLPKAYENLDIITTHGYEGGWKQSDYELIRDYRDRLAAQGKGLNEDGSVMDFYNNEQTAKLQKGDGLFEIFDSYDEEPFYVGDVSIALRISDAVNAGVNNFFIFQLGNAGEGNNAALLGTPYGGSSPHKTSAYFGYKQLLATQPDNSNCIGRTLDNTDKTRVLCFRKDNENFVYVHITNVTLESKTFIVEAKNLDQNVVGITSIETLVNDMDKEDSVTVNETFAAPVKNYVIETTPMSVTTLKIGIE